MAQYFSQDERLRSPVELNILLLGLNPATTQRTLSPSNGRVWYISHSMEGVFNLLNQNRPVLFYSGMNIEQYAYGSEFPRDCARVCYDTPMWLVKKENKLHISNVAVPGHTTKFQMIDLANREFFMNKCDSSTHIVIREIRNPNSGTYWMIDDLSGHIGAIAPDFVAPKDRNETLFKGIATVYGFDLQQPFHSLEDGLVGAQYRSQVGAFSMCMRDRLTASTSDGELLGIPHLYFRLSSESRELQKLMKSQIPQMGMGFDFMDDSGLAFKHHIPTIWSLGSLDEIFRMLATGKRD